MDLRQKKTLRAISQAFYALRKQKKLEAITVTELCAQAEISKATFYLHYRDIFDLSEKLQMYIINEALNQTEISASIMDHFPEFSREITAIMDQYSAELAVLFSGSQMGMIPILLEDQIRARILEQSPELKEDSELSIRLTYHVQGSYHTYLRHAHHTDMHRILDIIHDIHDMAGMRASKPQ